MEYGLGRNVNLFDDLRLYAYRHVLGFKDSSNFDAWMREIENQAINLNTLCNPKNLLPFGEVKATARSIGKWTWKNFSHSSFSSIQASRGRKNEGKKKNNYKNKANIEKMINFLGGEK